MVFNQVIVLPFALHIQGDDGDDGGGSLDAAGHGRARLAMLVRKEAEERRRGRIVK